MKLKEYADKINWLLEKYGGDLYCVYAIDDEGNDFRSVEFKPEAGKLLEGGFVGTDEAPECVCVN